MAEPLTYIRIRKWLGDQYYLRNNAFEVMQGICRIAAGDSDNDRTQAQELILRAMERREDLGESVEVLDGLVREFGLFPYLDLESLGTADAIAYEFHRPLNMEQQKVVFHRVQAEVYRYLLDGESVAHLPVSAKA
jgi:hypothetical protein